MHFSAKIPKRYFPAQKTSHGTDPVGSLRKDQDVQLLQPSANLLHDPLGVENTWRICLNMHSSF
jgi:hypothetical protein